MKKRKIILVVCMFAVMLCAPVFSSWENGLSPTLDNTKAENYGSFWVNQKESFLYLFLFGIWKHELLPECNFYLYTRSDKYSQFKILNASVVIDGADVPLSNLEGAEHKLDIKPYRANTLYRAVNQITFNLKKLPAKSIRVHIEGVLISDSTDNSLFLYDEEAMIKKGKRIFPMFRYPFYILNET